MPAMKVVKSFLTRTFLRGKFPELRARARRGVIDTPVHNGAKTPNTFFVIAIGTWGIELLL
jgi:hypothetical protein